MVAAWNAAHPDEKVTRRRSPPASAPKRSSAPPSPPATRRAWSSTPRRRPCRSSRSRAGWCRSTNFPDGTSTTSRRAPAPRPTSTSRADGKLLPDAVEVQPGHDLLQQGPMKKAGVDPENPPLATYDEFLATSREDRAERRAPGRHLPGADERVLPVLVRLLPAVRRRERRQAAGRGRQGDLRRPRRPGGRRTSGGRMYDEGLAPKEKYNGDSFADEKAAMAIVGPWAIAVYGQGQLGRRAGADLAGQPADDDPHLLRRQEHRDVLRLQEPGHGLGRREVRHQQGAGRQAAREHRPDAAAHRPAERLPGLLRQANPDYKHVRRAGGPDGRGAQRVQLHRDLAGPSATRSPSR